MDWNEDSEAPQFSPVYTRFRLELAAARDAGVFGPVRSFDSMDGLENVLRWTRLLGEIKNDAVKYRDEWLGLTAVRVELGLHQLPPAQVYDYLFLSARDGREMDQEISEFLGGPLRFCRLNYPLPFKPRGNTRRRPREGWAEEVLRGRKHGIGTRNRPNVWRNSDLAQISVQPDVPLGEETHDEDATEDQDPVTDVAGSAGHEGFRDSEGKDYR